MNAGVGLKNKFTKAKLAEIKIANCNKREHTSGKHHTCGNNVQIQAES